MGIVINSRCVYCDEPVLFDPENSVYGWQATDPTRRWVVRPCPVNSSGHVGRKNTVLHDELATKPRCVMYEPRPIEEIAGSPENLSALRKLLKGWACCGAPGRCGVPCLDSELSDALSHAAKALGLKAGC